jgi:hypothetical protein
MKINELRLIENIDILFESKIILYGAGLFGTKMCKDLGILGVPVSYFCDSDIQKHGMNLNGIEVISPNGLKDLDDSEDLTIIITTAAASIAEQIIDILNGLYLKTRNIFTMYGLNISLLKNINDSRFDEKGRDLYHKMCEIEKMNREYYLRTMRLRLLISYTQVYLESNDCIVVYTAGKVGSSSIVASLNATGVSSCQPHFLRKEFYYKWNIGFPKESIDKCCDIFRCSDKVKIITLVREPVSKDISRFFQDLDLFGRTLFIQPGDSFMNVATNFIVNKKPLYHHAWTQFEWFDIELKSVFGVDIYDHPFDREKGYSIIEQGNVEVLAMKLEKLNGLESVIGEFVGAPDFKLVNTNVGNEKLYKYLYKNVLEVIKLPREFFAQYYENNPQMDHFYTKDEIASFRKKWENNIE